MTAQGVATPRRLTLTVHGIPARQSDLKEERKGRASARPDAAIIRLSQSHRPCLAR